MPVGGVWTSGWGQGCHSLVPQVVYDCRSTAQPHVALTSCQSAVHKDEQGENRSDSGTSSDDEGDGDVTGRDQCQAARCEGAPRGKATPTQSAQPHGAIIGITCLPQHVLLVSQHGACDASIEGSLGTQNDTRLTWLDGATWQRVAAGRVTTSHTGSVRMAASPDLASMLLSSGSGELLRVDTALPQHHHGASAVSDSGKRPGVHPDSTMSLSTTASSSQGQHGGGGHTTAGTEVQVRTTLLRKGLPGRGTCVTVLPGQVRQDSSVVVPATAVAWSVMV
jgi:hypothetical protein